MIIIIKNWKWLELLITKKNLVYTIFSFRNKKKLEEKNADFGNFKYLEASM